MWLSKPKVLLQVRTLAQYMAERVSSGTKLQYTSAKVVRAESVGPGDRCLLRFRVLLLGFAWSCAAAATSAAS